MQSKALAPLAVAAIVAALSGCGGGSDGTSTGPSAQAPGEQRPLTERVEEARKKAEERQRSGTGTQGSGREAKGGEGAGSEASGGGGAGPEGSAGGAQEGQSPQAVEHHDSGGGAAQFRTPHGDNSIQEAGQEGSASERAVAAAALHAFYDDRAARDWPGACANLALSAIAAMEAAAKRASETGGGPKLEGCAAVLRAFSEAATHRSEVEAAEHIDVGAFRIKGNEGFLLYHGVRGHDYAIQMLREDGTWKVAGLVGTPLS